MDEDRPVWDAKQLQQPHAAPDKAERVQVMFNAIARRYELVNTVFSLGIDSRWRQRAVRACAVGPDDRVLDIACGTGDFARAFARAGAQQVVGCDFAHQMLVHARRRPPRAAQWCEADALHLPFAAGSFTITSCAFGVRNFADLEAGLREMHRVLAPRGRAVILEFTRPANRLVRAGYELYSNHLMPRAAALLSRDRTGAYRYLPRSVVSFLPPEQMCAALERAGFDTARALPLTFGVVTVYLARRD